MSRTLKEITASFKPWDGNLPPLGHVVVQSYRYDQQKQTKQLVVAHSQDVKPARSWGEGLLQQQRRLAPFTIQEANKPSRVAWDGEALQVLKRAPKSVSISGPYLDNRELDTLSNNQIPCPELDTTPIKPTEKPRTVQTVEAPKEFDPFGL
jgi:hypothetical protein